MARRCVYDGWPPHQGKFVIAGNIYSLSFSLCVCSYSLFSSLYFAFSLFFLLFFFNPFLPSISLLCYAYSHLFLFIFNKAHFSDLVLPITDYITDTNSVLDQAIRILQAMVDVAADGGWLFTSLNCMQLMQMVMQVQPRSPYALLSLSKGQH